VAVRAHGRARLDAARLIAEACIHTQKESA
jgi:hypothetical protein